MQREGVAEELPGCTIDEVSEAWAQVVGPWCGFVRDGHDVHREHLHGRALLEACGDVRGRRVLDLGCGEGWCSREMAGRGATVAAVDVCQPMVAAADAHPIQEAYPVEYLVMDAVDVHRHPWPAGFDLVTACMSLHSMPDPARALRAVRQVLTPKGRLVCSIPHPLTHMRGGRQSVREHDDALYIRAGGYFGSAPYRVWWNPPGSAEPWPTIRWSRPLGEYARMLRDAGFVISDELEPYPTAADVDEHERLRKAADLPYYLVLVAELSLHPPD